MAFLPLCTLHRAYVILYLLPRQSFEQYIQVEELPPVILKKKNYMAYLMSIRTLKLQNP